MKRLEIILNSVVFLGVVFSLFYSWGVDFWSYKQSYEATQQEQANDLEITGSIIEAYLERNDLLRVKEKMSWLRQSLVVQFFSLSKNGQVIVNEDPYGIIKKLGPIDYTKSGKDSRGEIRFLRFQVGPYQFLDGYTVNPSLYYFDLFSADKYGLLMKFVFNLILQICLLLLLGHRVLSLLERPEHLQREDELFVSWDKIKIGVNNLKATVHRLEGDVASLVSQHMAWLVDELREDRNLFEPFDTNWVSIDLNSFSKLQQDQDIYLFAKLMDEFVLEGEKIIKRYSGRLYDFPGDEFIFYTTEKSSENSSLLALNCVRELLELAARLHARQITEAGHPFVFKAFISREPTFLKKAGHSIMPVSNGIIRLKRMAKHVTELDRNENLLWFDQSVKRSVADYCEFFERGPFELTGFKEQVHVCQFTGGVDLYSLLSANKIEHVGEFRSVADICTILNFVASQAESLDLTTASRLLGQFKNYRFETFDDRIVESFVELLNKVRLRPEILSRAIAAGKNLLVNEAFKNVRVRSLMAEFLSHTDRRVVADTIEFLTHVAPEMDLPGHVFDLDTSNNRVFGNAIVNLAVKGEERVLLKKLKVAFKHRNKMFQASGIYALRVLYLHYSGRNELYMPSKIRIAKLTNMLDKFERDPDPFVSGQARLTREQIEKSKQSLMDYMQKLTEIRNSFGGTPRKYLNDIQFGKAS